MSAYTGETWENVYSGFDRSACRDTTGHLLDLARWNLPKPIISSACKSKGHDWKVLPNPLSSETVLRGCVRCAKRGMVVFQSEAK